MTRVNSSLLLYAGAAAVCVLAKLHRVGWSLQDWNPALLLDGVVEDIGVHLCVLGGAQLAFSWTNRPLTRGWIHVGIGMLALFMIFSEAVAVTTLHVTGVAVDRFLAMYVFENVVMVSPLLLTEMNLGTTGLLVLASLAWVALRLRRSLAEASLPIQAGPGWILIASGLVCIALPPFFVSAGAARALPIEWLAGPWVDPVERDEPGHEVSLEFQDTQTLAPISGPPAASSGAAARPSYANVVFIALESTGRFATTLDPDGPATTPFLRELSQRSVDFERAYAVVTHTSKALVAMLCGVEPYLLMDVVEAAPQGIPARCLPELLQQRGIETRYFGSHTSSFENRAQLASNLGFAARITKQELDGTGFELANYLAYEDDILLEPTRQWLASRAGGRFFAFYLTSTAHHDYQLPARYPLRSFVADDTHNRYLNAVYYQDQFVRQLMDVYRAAGVERETLFVVVGDHGEAFGEHRRFLHDAVIHDEGLRVPLLLYGAGLAAARRSDLVSQLDLPVTISALLGFRLSGTRGLDLFDRARRSVAYAACWYSERCLARITPDRKLISHFDHAPPEAYAIRDDPRELVDVFGQDSRDADWLEDLHRWKRSVLARYEPSE